MKEAKKESQLQQGRTGESEFNRGEDTVGRAYHKDDTYDISHVDRQEGAMHHGVVGGNFECEEDDNTRTPEREDTNK